MILGQVMYTLTVRNTGPSPATGVTLTDALPARETSRPSGGSDRISRRAPS